MDVDALLAQLDVAADVLLSLGMRVRNVAVTPTDVPPGLTVLLTVTPPVRPLAYTVEAQHLPAHTRMPEQLQERIAVRLAERHAWVRAAYRKGGRGGK